VAVGAGVALIGQHDNPGVGQFAVNATDAGSGQVVHGTGKRAGYPHDLAVRAGDHLEIHRVAAVLAGVERPVGGHPVDGDYVPSITT
jgi:hypothetical protein